MACAKVQARPIQSLRQSQNSSNPNRQNNNSSNLDTMVGRRYTFSEKSPPTVQETRRVGEDPLVKYPLEHLELKTTIGTGTFGRVILARHPEGDDYFALKIMPMAEVIRLKQVEHVQSEKDILSAIKYPFIVDLMWTKHDNRFLYMLFEYICGGELFFYLRNAGRFTSSMANFYTAEIVSTLDYLHERNIVYRDLKPENLLLDREGHLKLTDFGFAKYLDDRTYTLCGTPEYLAPEIIQSKGHNKAVDWWALGILVYEMLVGYPPFYDDNAFGIYEKILVGKVTWPKKIDGIAKDLVRKLLVQDRTKRLGNMKNGAEDVKNHRWFRHIDWDDVRNKKLQPPVRPHVTHRGDTRNFYEYPELQIPSVTNGSQQTEGISSASDTAAAENSWPEAEVPLLQSDINLFQNF